MISPNDCLSAFVAKFGVKSEDVFYDLRHQEIFRAMVDMSAKGTPIELVMLNQELRDKKLLEQVGGTAYLASLGDKTMSAANLEYYLDILHSKFLLRQILKVGTDIVCQAYEDDGDARGLLEKFERDALAIRAFELTGDTMGVKELSQQAMADFETAVTKKSNVDGIPTGLNDVDDLTGGMHGGEMIVVCGFTSQGKSSLAMNIAEHACLVEHHPVGVFTLEMTAIELVKRCICSHARVNLRNLRQGFVADRDFPKLVDSAAKFSNSAIHFDETSGLSEMELRARARRMWQRYGIKLLIIDYLQLLCGSRRHYDRKQAELEDISRSIKNLAKELNIPVIAISQLTDEGKLFGSRTIGHDGDTVWKLQKVKKKDQDNAKPGEPLPVELLVLKNRNGPTGKADLMFFKQFTRFENAAKVQEPEPPQQQSMPYADQ